MRLRFVACLCVLVSSTLAVRAIEVDIDSRAIDQAVAIARERRDAVIRTFNDRYVLAPSDPRFERIEIITEFRRVVLMGRERIAAGNFSWTGTE